jgi:putative transposase-like DNA-binding protein
VSRETGRSAACNNFWISFFRYYIRMSRYRLEPTREQEAVLLRHRAAARIVHLQPGDVRRLNRRWSEVRVPKAGWVRFRWSRAVPADAKSFRVTRDRAGRWHVAFAVNRGISRSGWGLLVRRLEDKALGRVEKIPPAFTSQRCSACGHVAAESRESQALFRCVACAYTENADVNAARNIAAGHAVTAREGLGDARPVNGELQLLLRSA